VCVRERESDLRISKTKRPRTDTGRSVTDKSREALYKRDTGELLRNHYCLGEAVSIIYSECVSLALVTQHAKHMHLLYCHLWPVCLCRIFPQYLINGTIFGETLLNITCVFSFSLQPLPETFLILRKIQRDIKEVYIRLHVKYPLFMSDFNQAWVSSTDISKILKYTDPMGDELFYSQPQTDRQDDMTKLIVFFAI